MPDKPNPGAAWPFPRNETCQHPDDVRVADAKGSWTCLRCGHTPPPINGTPVPRGTAEPGTH